MRSFVFTLLVCCCISWTHAEDNAATIQYGPTTLEQALTHSYNLKVADGTWARLFGRESFTGFRADNFCTGNNEGWPLPEVNPGSDLEKVLERQTFRCGHINNTNFETPAGALLFRGFDNDIRGASVEFWNEMVAQLGELYEQPVSLEWTLFPRAQDVLTAVQTGLIDGACAYWQSDGVWVDPNGNRIARGLAFSKMTCPTVVQTEYIWVLKDTFASFQELVAAIDDGTVTYVCAATTPGAGTETNCRNTLRQFTRDGVPCDGRGPRTSFELLRDGECSAVWSGNPSPELKELMIQFPQPAAIARVSYMRSADMSVLKAAPDNTTGRFAESTTLEQAVAGAFNRKVSDGTYAKAVGGLEDLESVAFCTGAFPTWGTPVPMPQSDLQAVLDRGVFRCGYPRSRVVETTDGKVLMDTTGDQVQGIIADFWSNAVIPALGAMYNKTLTLEWVLHTFEVRTFNDLYEGNVDAACAMWNPDGIWVDRFQNRLVARPLAFSPMYCPAFLQTANIYTTRESQITTFDLLVQNVLRDRVTEICVSDDVTAGTVNTCQDTMREYTGRAITCTGSTSATIQEGETATEEAFRRLNSGICEAVWGGAPARPQDYYSFQQPTVLVPVSFFRYTDVAFLPVRTENPTGTPTIAPTATPSRAVDSHTMMTTALSLVAIMMVLC